MRRDIAPLPHAWRVVGLLWFVGGFNYLTRIMLTTMHASIVHAVPMDEKQFGLLTSAFLWIYALLSPAAGFLSDRFSRSRVIIISMLTWSAVTWLTGFARNFEELLAMRALMGVAEACYLPAALALITDYHRGSTRSLAIGVHMTGIYFGSGLGGLGGWLAEHHSWSFAFNAVGMCGVLYGVVLIFALRDAPRPAAAGALSAPPPARFLDGVASLFSDSGFILALAFWGLIGFAGWLVSGWMPTFFQERFHLTQSAAGFISTGYSQMGALLGVLVGGVWSDRWSRTKPRARLLVPIIGLCLAIPGLVLTAQSGLLLVAIIGLTSHMFFRSFSDANMMPILCLVSDARYRATGYGILNCFSCIVGGIAIYAGGVLRDAHLGLTQIFVFAAGTILICALLLWLIKPRPDGETEAAEAAESPAA